MTYVSLLMFTGQIWVADAKHQWNLSHLASEGDAKRNLLRWSADAWRNIAMPHVIDGQDMVRPIELIAIKSYKIYSDPFRI